MHGIVYARGTVKGKPVAFSLSRTTYFHEADSALGFFCLNQPSCVSGPDSFRNAVRDINFGFNWGYIDAEHTAYQQSGWYPRRAKGTSPDFPVLGTGEYDWKGYNPDLHTQDVLSIDERPHVVDQPITVSWNGKQARGWGAADDNYAYGSLQRMAMIRAFLRRAAKGPKKVSLEQVVQAMEEPATQDIRGRFIMPILLRALGRPKDPKLAEAAALLRDWHKAGSHRRDLDKDGVYDDDAAVTLMDAWWPRLAAAEFAVLGDDVKTALLDMLPYDAELAVDGQPSAPAFYGGWYGYVHKDLRTLFTPKKVKGKFSRVYCGGGSKKRCRRALRTSLREALGVPKADLYGRGDCADGRRRASASTRTARPSPPRSPSPPSPSRTARRSSRPSSSPRSCPR